MTSPIYDVLVDTHVPGFVELYLLQSNGVLKKFSASIPTDATKVTELEFVEHKYPYLIEKVFTDKPSAATKKLDLNNLKANYRKFFIANQVLYCSNARPIDLRAELLSVD
jgi:hypothetical protein